MVRCFPNLSISQDNGILPELAYYSSLWTLEGPFRSGWIEKPSWRFWNSRLIWKGTLQQDTTAHAVLFTYSKTSKNILTIMDPNRKQTWQAHVTYQKSLFHITLKRKSRTLAESLLSKNRASSCGQSPLPKFLATSERLKLNFTIYLFTPVLNEFD